MKRWWPIGLTVLLLCSLGGCGKSKHEELAEENLALQSEFCDIMDGVTDQASADAAIPKLQKLGARMIALGDREETLGRPSKEELERINKKLAGQHEKLQKRREACMAKLSNYPELSTAFAIAKTKVMAGSAGPNLGGSTNPQPSSSGSANSPPRESSTASSRPSN